MSKLIITEINRIQELMGKPLIMEAVFKTLIDDIITFLAKKSNKIDGNLKKLIDNLKAATDDTTRGKILSDLVNQSKEISEIIVPRIIKTLPQNVIEEISIFKYNLSTYIKNGKINPQGVNSAIDSFVKKNVVTNIQSVKDIIMKDLTDYANNLFKQTDELINKTTKLTDEIPEGSLTTSPYGEKIPEIFNVNTWNSKSIKIDEDVIARLVNNKMWDKVKREFESLITVTRPRIQYIQRLAKAINTTDNAEYQVELERMLKSELEWLYGKNTSTFVNLKRYFDNVAKTDPNWGTLWRQIKSNTDGGWDFYNVFGVMAQNMSWFKRVWEGILSDIKVNFETESNVLNWIGNKTVGSRIVPRISKESFKGNLLSNIVSGSRSGFPKMSNKNYEQIISRYGPTSAKARYFRDLIVQALRWNFYIGFLVTVRDTLANSFYENDIAECANSKDMNSESCKKITETKFGRKMAEWSMAWRKDPNSSVNFFEKWLADELFSLKSNLPQLAEKDDEWRIFAKLSTLDPGSVGEIYKGFHDLVRFNDDPASVDNLIKYLNEQIEFAKNKSEDVRERLNDEVERVEDRAENIVDNIKDSEPGFRLWCQRNEKEFAGYNVDGDGLGRTKKDGVITTWSWNNDTKTFDEY